MRKVAVVTSASGSGGTTAGREIARRLEVPFHELDALFWKPSWTEPEPEEFRARVAEVAATDFWLIDGSYQSWLGQSELEHAEVVVWLDLPVCTWLPRLVGRTLRACPHERDALGHEPRVDPRSAVQPGVPPRVHCAPLPKPSAALSGAVRNLEVIRLRTQAEVDRFMRSL